MSAAKLSSVSSLPLMVTSMPPSVTPMSVSPRSVSYTHLTLPTILRV